MIKLDVGNDRSISIYQECGWVEISTGIYYAAEEAGNVVVLIRLIEFYERDSIDQFDFEVACAENQSLVGVYDRAGLFTDVILVLGPVIDSFGCGGLAPCPIWRD